jgi:hypothetical protein
MALIVMASGPVAPECRITRGLNKAFAIQRYRGENMEIFENILHFTYLNSLSSTL